ncbi:MAG: hypothetical protein ACP5Q1_04070 [Anaerolineae bacterium]
MRTRYIWLLLLFGCFAFFALPSVARGALPPIWVATNLLGLEPGGVSVSSLQFFGGSCMLPQIML